MSAELREYVRHKSTAFIVVMAGLLILGWLFNAVMLIGVVSILLGITGFALAWLVERGIIKQNQVGAAILVGSGFVMLVVGLILKGVIPLLSISGDVATDAILTTTIYIILSLIVVFTAYTVYKFFRGEKTTGVASISEPDSEYIS